MSKLIRHRAPHPTWTKLGVPLGSLIVGRSRYKRRMQYIPYDLLFTHILLAAATGSGKSYLLASLIVQLCLQLDGIKRGVTVLDPHGTLIKLVMRILAASNIHKHRDIVILRPGLGEPFGFNFLRPVPGLDPAVQVDIAVGAVFAVWREDPNETPRLRQALSAIFYAILKCNLTLNEAVDLLALHDNSGLRRYVTEQITDPVFKQYFIDFEALPIPQRRDEIASCGRRINEFLKLDICKKIFGVRDPEKCIDLRKVMDDGAIVLIDLTPGPHLSEDGSALLGALLINGFLVHAIGRDENSTPHHVVVDEANKFITPDAAKILDQARKFGLSFLLSVQHLAQIREKGEAIYASVMTNTRTKIIMGGLSDDDSVELARNCWRGALDLSRNKSRFDKFVPVGEELVWLANEGLALGRTSSRGENWTDGTSRSDGRSTIDSRSTTASESLTDSESTTTSRSIARHESTTLSKSHTTQESKTLSESDTTSHSVTRSESETASRSIAESSTTTDSEGESEADIYSETDGYTDSTSEGSSLGTNRSRSYDYDGYPAGPFRLPDAWHEGVGESDGSTEGSAHAESSSSSFGRSSSRSRGRSSSAGLSETRGESRTTGTAETTGTARSTGVARTTGSSDTTGEASMTGTTSATGEARTAGTARQRGRTETTGTAVGRSTSLTRSDTRGGSVGTAESEQRSRGYAQAYHQIMGRAPTVGYTLEELYHLTSCTIANLPTGHCLLKVGRRRPVYLTTPRLKPRPVSDEHLARVYREIAERCPFVLPAAQAQIAYNDFREELAEKLEAWAGAKEE